MSKSANANPILKVVVIINKMNIQNVRSIDPSTHHSSNYPSMHSFFKQNTYFTPTSINKHMNSFTHHLSSIDNYIINFIYQYHVNNSSEIPSLFFPSVHLPIHLKVHSFFLSLSPSTTRNQLCSKCHSFCSSVCVKSHQGVSVSAGCFSAASLVTSLVTSL